MWQKAYGGSGQDNVRSLAPTSDGDYIAVGSTSSFGAGSSDFWVLKLDGAGGIVWQKTYGGSGDDVADSVVVTNDGFAVAGWTNSSSHPNSGAWVLKLDEDGNVVWQKTFGQKDAFSNLFGRAHSIVATSDGGFAVAGQTAPLYGQAWVLKLDEDGNVVWQKTYGGPYNEDANSIVATSDGGYAVAGYAESFGERNGDFWVLKLDVDGNVVWQKTLGGSGIDRADSVVATSDGGFALAGQSYSFGGQNAWMLQLDGDGNVVWEKTYGGASSDVANSLVATGDGGFAVAGGTGSFEPGGVWVLKLDGDGNIGDGSCSISRSTSSTTGNSSTGSAEISTGRLSPTFTVSDSSATVTDTNVQVGIQCGVTLYSISGGVTDASNNPIEGVTVSAVSYGSDMTDANGNYSIDGLAVGTYTLTPTKSGYSFSPPSLTVTVPTANPQNFTAVQHPPLILVHGWQRTGGYQCSQNITPYDVDLANSTLGKLAKWYQDMGYQVWIAHLTSGPTNTPSILENAKCLSNQIRAVHDQNSQPITLVSHSMGGLVSRAALEFLPANIQIDSLFTLGSPHAGLPFDILQSVFSVVQNQPGVWDMEASQMERFNRLIRNVKDVDYYFIGGDATTFGLGWLVYPFVGANDGFVGRYGAVGWKYPNQAFTSDWAWNLKGQYWTDEVHIPDWGNSYYSEPPGDIYSFAFACMKSLIQNPNTSPNPSDCRNAQNAAQSAEFLSVESPQTSFSELTELKTGHLNSGQTVSIPLQIDTNAGSLFYLTWSGDEPTFTLTRPDAQVIDPAYAATHPSEVTYGASLGGASALPYAVYDFTTTQSGIWQLNLTASGDVDYQGFAALETERTLTTQTDSSLYQIGDVATITTTLTSAGVGLPGATVTATLTRLDEIVDAVDLIDPENDGTYTGIYSIPDAPGHLGIEITVSGNDNGTAFTRQENLLVSIAPNDLLLTGTYGDQPRDDNANGSYDYLDFTAEVNLTTPGEYAVSAELYAGNQLVTQAGDFFPLVAGTQTITLPFYGGAIYEAGLDGPYTVKNLYFTPIDIGITAQSVENAWTTAAYSYTEFLDTISPVVSSVTRIDPNPTSAASVNFAVTISEAVTGVDTSDFSLTTTGVSGVTVSGVSGSGSSYTVTVNTGSGNGTIRLDVVDDDTIMDSSGNLLEGGFTTGEEYTVEKPTTTVQFSGSTYNVNENEGSATITVNLSSAASQTVSVHYATNDGSATTGSDYSATSGDLIFDLGVTNQTFSVPITNDNLIEGDETVNLVLSSPVNATLGSPNSAVLTIVDNDIAGIIVTPTSGLVTTEGGGADSFNVMLDSQPADNVTIGLSSSDTTEGTASPISLTFTPSNWNTLQTVTVTGVDDSIVDGDIAYTIVIAPASSIDPNYNGLNAADVSVTNNDNDTATNLIFTEGFESGDLSAWSSCGTDGGDLSVSAAAKYLGNHGMQAILDDNIAIYCTSDHPDAEPRYVASFNFDPNSITMVNGDTQTIFGGYAGTSTLILRVQFRRSSNLYQVRVGLINDGTTWKDSSWFTITDAYHQIKLDWRAASAAGANDGNLKIWIDGSQVADLTAVDNDTRRIDRARLGAVAAIDAGTRGAYYFDEFESSRGEDTQLTATLTVNKTGTGSGTVTSNPAGIDCGLNCSYAFSTNTVVTLTATANSGSTFTGWSGEGCSGTGTCTVTMDVAESVTANFDLQSSSHTLTVNKMGTGSGTVTSSPPGLDCGSDCLESYTPGTVVTLTVTAASGSTFTGWDGDADCSDGQVTMNASKTCTANFDLSGPSANLLQNPSFEKDDNGDNKPDVWSTNAKFTRSSEVAAFDGSYAGSFRATDNSGSNSTQSVFNLSAGTTYNFSGWVNIPPQGDTTFTFKVQVIWKNASNGTIRTDLVKNYTTHTGGNWNEAVKTMVAPAGTVKADIKMVASSLNGSIYVDNFLFGSSGSVSNYTLTVNKTGTGSGNVTGNPPGINCGSDCTEAYASGTNVTLTASPDSGSIFTGWSGGGCSGSGTCTVNLTSNKSVTANFDIQSNDTTAPSLSWIAPVGDTQAYDVGNQTIQLEVSASDNVGVTEVIFYRWDYVNLEYLEIGRVFSAPYRINFDTSILLPDANEIDAFAFDAAGNLAIQYIWLNHTGTDPDLIFANSFNDDDCFLTEWTACADDGGDLEFNGPPLIEGGDVSMSIRVDDNNVVYLTSDHPNAEPRYRARFYFDPNSISMLNGDLHRIFYGYSGSSKVIIRLELRRNSNTYQIRPGLLNDGGSWVNGAWVTITDAPHPIEIDWRAATAVGANNGGLTLWIDGAQKANLTADNDTLRIDRVQLGAVNGIDAGTRGTYYFDAFESRRQTYIGP
jgi:pimeloyl-ACP methyl ester carboxylesterase